MAVEIDLMSEDHGNLDGKILVATPDTDDARFERAVVYLCMHSKDGSMGIMLNRAANSITFADLVERLDILGEGEKFNLPDEIGNSPIHLGGPLETEQGFVLHSRDYPKNKYTVPIDENISLSTTLEIVKDIVRGRGPKKLLFALGYAGWGPGQLEWEIQSNGWLVGDSHEEIIFNKDMKKTYDLALRKNGIEPALLSRFGGHA